MPIAELNSDQQNAATSPQAEVAVSAGAGSGKTRLLVARYLHYVIKEKLPLHAIAAITFTNKAADQMKARVAEQARMLAAKNPDDSIFWRKVADDINHAFISTIHSFCSGILRAHPVEAGIDPAFTVLDEVVNSEVRAGTVDSFVARRQSEIPDDMAFLADVFGITGLKQTFLSLLRSRPHVVKFLDRIDHDGGIDEASIASVFLTVQKKQLNDYLEILENFHALRPPGDGFVPEYARFVELLRDCVSMIGNDSGDIGRIESELAAVNVRKGSPDKWGKETLREVKEAIKECRDVVQRIIAYRRTERHVLPKVVSLVLREFVLLDAAYLMRKKSLSAYDNDDILIETWRLLRSNARLCRTISQSFRHILVDEFQDTDGIQMDILNMIAGNSSAALFAVGDPKQSIYRFRGADVGVFNAFIEQKGTEFHRLKINYRSRPAVLKFVNTAFELIIGTEPDTDFDTIYVPMKPDPRKVDDGTPCVDLIVIDSNDASARRAVEAEQVASRIAAIREHGINGKQYRLGDMAVLLRKSTAVDFYEEALLKHGIPFVNRIGGRLSGHPAAFDIGNLLGWLNEPENPALLTAVLLSPFVRFDADTVFRLRSLAGSAGDMSSWLLGARSSGDEEFDTASELLSDLLRRVNRVSIRTLLEHAFDRTGYTLSLLADPVSGDRSLAVTDLILDTADRFEENGGTSAEFAGLLLSGREFTSESAHVETDGDAVPIMTIHGAKGLEFPVVFLADIPDSIKGGNSDTLLFDDTIGPGLKMRDERGVRLETYASWLAKEENRKRDIAENKRLFYVGCTRAEDYLAVLGGRPKKADDTYEGNNWMSWLHSSLGIPVDGEEEEVTAELFRLFRIPDTDSPGRTSAYDNWQKALADTREPADGSVHFDDRLIADIPPVAAASAPVLLSPTRIIEYRTCPARYYYRYVHGLDLTFVGRSGSGAGAAYGTYTHRVMERIDFDDPDGWAGTAQELYDHTLPEKMLTSLTTALEQFAGSSLYREALASADEIRREEPFILTVGTVLLRGTIDLYWKAGDEIAIVDYKTTAAVPETVDGISEEYRFQLGLYALALFKVLHMAPSRLILHFFGADRSFYLPCDEQYLAEVENELHAVVKRMTDGDFSPVNGSACENCPYGYLCDM